MAKLYPGIIYATLAAIPGIWLATYLASPRLQELPIGEIVQRLLNVTPFLFLLYGTATLIYGSLAWWLLRLLGLLNLPCLIVAAAIPVICYFVWSVSLYGWEPRAPWALLAFWLPTLFISVTLWWFTVYASEA